MYILIDIGGTNTRVARTLDRETFSEPIMFTTPQNFDEWFKIIIHYIDDLREGQEIKGIIAGMAGTFTNNHSTVHKSPNLPEWNGVNLKEKLGGWFNCPMLLENDCAVVGLGEAVFGSGKGYDIVVYITISTGVGGARIVDGKIDKNKYGFEIGHQIIDNGRDLEYYLGGNSHEKRFGIPSKDIKDENFWKEVNYYTGVCAANTIMYWSPAILVFGGPVMNDIDLEEAVSATRKLTPLYDTLPFIVRSSLKSYGGIYGAMALAKQLP